MNSKTKCNCEGESILVQYLSCEPTPRWAWYDGWSEIRCQECKRRWGRWSGEELLEDQFEPKFGYKTGEEANA